MARLANSDQQQEISMRTFEGPWNEAMMRLPGAEKDKFQRFYLGANQALSAKGLPIIKANDVYFKVLPGDEVGRSSASQAVQLDSNTFFSGSEILQASMLAQTVMVHEQLHLKNKVNSEAMVDSMLIAMGMNMGWGKGKTEGAMELNKVGKYVEGANGNILEGLKKMHQAYAEDDMGKLSYLFLNAFEKRRQAEGYRQPKDPRAAKESRSDGIRAFQAIFEQSLDVNVGRNETRKEVHDQAAVLPHDVAPEGKKKAGGQGGQFAV